MGGRECPPQVVYELEPFLVYGLIVTILAQDRFVFKQLFFFLLREILPQCKIFPTHPQPCPQTKIMSKMFHCLVQRAHKEILKSISSRGPNVITPMSKQKGTTHTKYYAQTAGASFVSFLGCPFSPPLLSPLIQMQGGWWNCLKSANC